MSNFLRYLIAFIVGCHAFIYLRLGPTLPAAVKEWRGPSALLGEGVSSSQFKSIVVTLHLTAGIAILACALAIAAAPSIVGWWRPLAIAGGAVGIAAFAAFWDGQSKYLFHEGAIGALVSLILLASAIAFPRAFH
jgi:hypothetical protein